MGFAQITLKKVPVQFIDEKNHLIALKGPLPGAIKSLIFIQAQ